MQVQIWRQSQPWFLGLLKKQNKYMGPFPTVVLTFDPNFILVGCNQTLALFDTGLNRLPYQYHTKGIIQKVCSRKGNFLVLTDCSLELINEVFEPLRSFCIGDATVFSICSSPTGFKILHSGPKLPNQPLLRFIPVTPKATLYTFFQTCIASLDAPTLTLYDYQLDHTFQLQCSLPCTHLSSSTSQKFVCLTINKTTLLCFSRGDYKYLYSVPVTRATIKGEFLVEDLGRSLRVLELGETGVSKLGVMVKGEDELEAVVRDSKGGLWAVRQGLGVSEENRSIDRVVFITDNREKGRQGQGENQYKMDKVSQQQQTTDQTNKTIESDKTENKTTEALVKQSPVPQTPKAFTQAIEPIHLFITGQTDSPSTPQSLHSPNSPLPAGTTSGEEVPQILQHSFVESIMQIEGTPGLTPTSLSPNSPQSPNQLNDFGRSDHLFLKPSRLSRIWQQSQPASSSVQDSLPSLSHSLVCPSTIQQLFSVAFLAKPKALISVLQTKSFQEVMIKKLMLLPEDEEIGYDLYKVIREKSILELVEEVYRPRGTHKKAVEMFFQDVLRVSPNMVAVMFQDEQDVLAKMLGLVNRIRNRALASRFRKECWKLLSSYQLQVTPLELLPMPLTPDQKSLLLTLHPNLLLCQLSQPLPLLSTLLCNYFCTPQSLLPAITIESQLIQIANPRNMLNVLLYFGDVFKIQPQDTLKVYFIELMLRDMLELVREIVYEEGVLEVCGIKNGWMETVVKDVEKRAYQKDRLELLRRLLEGFGRGCTEEYTNKLQIRFNIIDIMNKSKLNFKPIDIYNVEFQQNAFQVLNNIITQSQLSSVLNIGIEFLYQKLHQLQSKTKLQYYTKDLLKLTQTLIIKCVSSAKYQQALELMTRIRPRLKPAFLIHLVFRLFKSNTKLAEKYRGVVVRGNPDELITLYDHLSHNEEMIQGGVGMPATTFSCGFQEFKAWVDRQRLIREETPNRLQLIYLVYFNPRTALLYCQYQPTLDAQPLHTFLVQHNPLSISPFSPQPLLPDLPLTPLCPVSPIAKPHLLCKPLSDNMDTLSISSFKISSADCEQWLEEAYREENLEKFVELCEGKTQVRVYRLVDMVKAKGVVGDQMVKEMVHWEVLREGDNEVAYRIIGDRMRKYMNIDDFQKIYQLIHIILGESCSQQLVLSFAKSLIRSEQHTQLATLLGSYPLQPHLISNLYCFSSTETHPNPSDPIVHPTLL